MNPKLKSDLIRKAKEKRAKTRLLKDAVPEDIPIALDYAQDRGIVLTDVSPSNARNYLKYAPDWMAEALGNVVPHYKIL